MAAARLSQKNTQRNQSIVDAYRNRNQTGESLIEIADRHLVSVASLRKIVSQLPKKRQERQRCCEPGCSELVRARGRCNKHYQQWWKANLAPEKRQHLAKSRRSSQQKYYDKGQAQEVYASYAETPKGKTARARSNYWSNILRFLNQAEPEAIAQVFPAIPVKAAQSLTENRPLTWAKIRDLLSLSQVSDIRKPGFDSKKARAINRQCKCKSL